MADDRRPSPSDEVRRLYEQSESRTARAFEELVSRDSFGELLARMTENVVAVTKISTDIFDLVLRNFRLAGRQDITRLARQLARTEDKLELLLQEIERLEEEREGSDSTTPRRTERAAADGRGRNATEPRGRRGTASGAGAGGEAP